MKKWELGILLVVLAAIALAVRVLPHPANFTPMAAIALFAGYYLPKKWAVILPVTVLLVSDLLLGFYEWKLMLVVYGCFALTGLVGARIKKSQSVLTVATSALLVSLNFFILTNLAVWAFSSWYDHTWLGLAQCFAMAVPFFRNTLLGDLFFVGVLFGSYELIKITLLDRLVQVANK